METAFFDKRLSHKLREDLRSTEEIVSRNLRSHFSRCKILELSHLLIQALKVKRYYDRALLVRVTAEGLGVKWKLALPAMLAIECLDIALIVIDDYLDSQIVRTDTKAFHLEFGIFQSLVAGIVLQIHASRLPTEFRTNHYSAQILNEFSSQLLLCSEEIYKGQYLDLMYEQTPLSSMTIKNYFKMISLTTGAELSCAMALGGILGQASDPQLSILQKLGNELGIIAQMRDDFIDWIDDAEKIGKKPFNDIQRKKKRLPLLLAYHYLSKRDKELLTTILHQSVISDIDARLMAARFIANESVLEQARKHFQIRRTKALKILRQASLFINNEACQKLRQLIELAAQF